MRARESAARVIGQGEPRSVLGLRAVLVVMVIAAVVLAGGGTMAGGVAAPFAVAAERIAAAGPAGHHDAAAPHRRDGGQAAGPSAAADPPCPAGDCGGSGSPMNDCLGVPGACSVTALVPSAPVPVRTAAACAAGATPVSILLAGLDPAADPPPPRA